MMDYLCAKFGDFGFSRFSFIMRTDLHTNRITESQIRMIAILKPGFHSNAIACVACVVCINENRKKRKRLRWQAANHG